MSHSHGASPTSAPWSPSRPRPARRPLYLLLLAALAACGDGGTEVTPSTPARLALTVVLRATQANAIEARSLYARTGGERVELGRERITVSAGASQQLALRLDLASCVKDPAHVGDASSCEVYVELALLRDATVLDRREAGPLHLTPGRATTAPSAVTVYEVARVEVSPAAGAALSIEPGDTVAFTARALDPGGSPIPGASLQWESGTPTIASIDAVSGIAVAVAPGAAPVRARSGAASAEVTLTVVPPAVASLALAPATGRLASGETLQLTAAPHSKRGAAIEGRTPTFATSDPTVATVSASGLVTALGAGTATIEARLDGKTASAQLTVTAGAPASIAIAPRPSSLEAGDAVQLSAVVKDARGNATTSTVAWQSLAPQVASVSATGLVTALTPGTVQIAAVAAAGGLGSTSPTDRLSITVVPPAVAAVGLQLNAPSIEAGELTQATATPRDRRGNALSGRAVSWHSSNTTVATVSASGLVTGVATGTTTLTATSEGVSGQATVAVTAPTVDRVTVLPPTLSLAVGAQQVLTAATVDRRGAHVPGQTIAWSSSAPAVASVATNGAVSAISLGTATITAAAGGKSGTAVVTVTSAASVSINGIFLAGTSTPANVSALTGPIDVALAYTTTPGLTPTRLELLLGSTVAGTLTLGQNGCTPCRLTLNTAAFDATTGVPSHLNGASSIGARLVLGGNTTVVSPTVPVALTNASGFVATVTNASVNAGFPGSAVNTGTGQTWIGGDVTLTLLHVGYVSGLVATSVSGTFFGKSFSNVAPLAGGRFVIAFPASGAGPLDIAGVQSSGAGDLPTITASLVAGGGTGPTAILNLGSAPLGNGAVAALAPVRLDNREPSAPTVVTPNPSWVNAAFSFATDAGIAPGADAGVAGVTTTFYYHTGGSLPAACSTAGLTPVATGAQIPASLVSTDYQARAVSRDALGNLACVDLPNRFGADFIAPAVILQSAPTANAAYDAITPPPPFSVSLVDNASGSPGSPLSVALVATSPFGGTSCVMGTGPSCTVTTYAGGTTFDATGNTGLPGYYTARITAQDAARNSTVVTPGLTYLVDNTPPIFAGNIAVSGAPGGGSATLSITALDDIDLADVSGTLSYGSTTIALAPQVLGSFGVPLEKSAPVTYPLALWRCVDGSAPGTATLLASDQAGHFSVPLSAGHLAAMVTPCGTAGDVPTNATSVSAPNPGTVSRSGASGTTLTARVDVPLNTSANPFASVNFYWQDAGGALRLAGTGAASVSQTGSNRVWSYAFAWHPNARVPLGTVTLVAIGIDGDTDGATLGATTVTVTP